MRIWQFWLNTLMSASQQDPYWLVELLMLFLATTLLGVGQIFGDWPYLVLALSYMVGASISILVRESFRPSPQPRIMQITAVLLLIVSVYSFAELI